LAKGKKVACFMTIFVFSLVLIGSVHATVITFDNIAPPSGDGTWPYSPPLNWEGAAFGPIWGNLENNSYNTTYNNSVVFPSGAYVAFNVYGYPEAILSSSSGYFNVQGAYFAAFARDNTFWQVPFGVSISARTLKIDGFRDGVLIGSTTFDLTCPSFTWHDINFSGINKLVIDDVNGQYWLMDNLTLDLPATLPLPGSLLLLSSGLVGLLGWRKLKDS
jgi:hypothetical protein